MSGVATGRADEPAPADTSMTAANSSGAADSETADPADEAEKTQKWDVAHPGGPSEVVEFDATEGTWISVDLHPDGTRIAFDLLGDIYTVPIEGGDAELVSGGIPWEIQPRYSPDGSRILFTSDRGGGDNLWLMNADGTNRRALTKETYRLLNNGTWHPTLPPRWTRTETARRTRKPVVDDIEDGCLFH